MLTAFSCYVNTELACLSFGAIHKCVWPYGKITGAYNECRSCSSSTVILCAKKAIKHCPSYPGHHPSGSNGLASTPLGLVRRVSFHSFLMPCQAGEGQKLMFCLLCSRKDCWMLRNLNVRMNWLGRRLAAYVSRAKWSTYQKRIASSSSVHQGNNF